MLLFVRLSRFFVIGVLGFEALETGFGVRLVLEGAIVVGSRLGKRQAGVAIGVDESRGWWESSMGL